ncbi:MULTISPECIES: hypothetical protein [Staphylococcus]|uniref:hypothetical protein n=1 Tax=Staphylococcus TaxID=1279 RepID=UPI0012DE3390|nr:MULTISPECIES: hypothetical protein [Staphylococcus]MBT2770010.1 hypothetical protein [Staphylococcus warneri]MCI2769439.1 hypothetical protein [Staphylococcus warneri]
MKLDLELIAQQHLNEDILFTFLTSAIYGVMTEFTLQGNGQYEKMADGVLIIMVPYFK